MSKWFLIASGIVVTGAVIAVFIGQEHESASTDKLLEALIQSAPNPVRDKVDFDSFSQLPPRLPAISSTS